jgi:hypothetical protein
MERSFLNRLRHADEVSGNFYCRRSGVLYMGRYVVWVAKTQAPSVTRHDLTTGDVPHGVLRQGPLNIVGTFRADAAPSCHLQKGDAVRLVKDAAGLMAVSE